MTQEEIEDEKAKLSDDQIKDLIEEYHSLKKKVKSISKRWNFLNGALSGYSDYENMKEEIEEWEALDSILTESESELERVKYLLKEQGITKKNHPELFKKKSTSIQQVEPSILIPYRKGEKWGFSDYKKSIIIECIYDEVKTFKNDYAAVKLDANWGYIDVHGNTVIPFYFEEALSFKDDKAVVLFMGNAYEINNKMELNLIDLTPGYKWCFGKETYFQSMDTGSSIIFKNIQISKMSFRDKIFNPLTPFEESLSMFNQRNMVNKAMIPFFEDSKFGYFSADKSILLPAIYDDGYDFEDDFAFVKINNQWGYINKQGIQYWDDNDFSEG